MPRKLKSIPQRCRRGGRQKGESEDTLPSGGLLESYRTHLEVTRVQPNLTWLKTTLAVRICAAHAAACWSRSAYRGSHGNTGGSAKWSRCRCSLESLLFKKTEFGINRLLPRVEYKPQEPDVVVGSSSQWVLKTVERLTTCICNNLKIF